MRSAWGLGDPCCEECRVAAGVEYCPVAFDLGVALGDEGRTPSGGCRCWATWVRLRRAGTVRRFVLDHRGGPVEDHRRVDLGPVECPQADRVGDDEDDGDQDGQDELAPPFPAVPLLPRPSVRVGRWMYPVGQGVEGFA